MFGGWDLRVLVLVAVYDRVGLFSSIVDLMFGWFTLDSSCGCLLYCLRCARVVCIVSDIYPGELGFCLGFLLVVNFTLCVLWVCVIVILMFIGCLDFWVFVCVVCYRFCDLVDDVSVLIR